MDSFADIDRLPPHSLDAERAVLGSMVLDPKVVPVVRATVCRESFYSADHQVVFDSLVTLSESGTAVDVLTLREDLIRRGVYEEIGGKMYLAQILNSVPSGSHAAHYAAVVREKYVRRQVIQVSNSMLRQAYAPANSDDEAQVIVDGAVAALARVTTQKPGSATSLDDILEGVKADLSSGGVPLVETGFFELDDCIGGMGLGEMWLLGARPSMGKSTMAKQIALRAARNGVASTILSLEESGSKIGRNLLAAECRLDNHRLRKPRMLNEHDWNAIDTGISQLRGFPLFVVDRARRLSDLRAELSLLVTRHNVQLAVVDYLQRVQVPGKDKYERAGNASEGLSDLFKELNVAGLVPVQLNRAVVGRDSKVPDMTDLRDSGQIEQDADGILFLHREDYYHIAEADYQPTHIAEVVVAKMRDGERGVSVKLESNLRYQTFENLSVAAEPPAWSATTGENHDPTEGMFIR